MNISMQAPAVKSFFEDTTGTIPAPVDEFMFAENNPLVRPNFLAEVMSSLLQIRQIVDGGMTISTEAMLMLKAGENEIREGVEADSPEKVVAGMRTIYNACKLSGFVTPAAKV